MKTLATVLLLLGVAAAQVIPSGGGLPTSSIVGQITTSTGGPVKNGTLTFSLSQPAIAAGTSTVVTQATACYTASSGNIVGIPDPIAVPVVTTNTATGTLPSGTYYVAIYYVDATSHVSALSPETTVVLSSTGKITVNAPVLQPAAAIGYGIAISTTSGTETIQGSVTGWTQFVQSTPLVIGSTPIASNNSSCYVWFSDALIPTGTYYTVSLANKNGSLIAGFPQTWCTYGGASGTIDVSQGAPTGVCNTKGVFYPTPIMANPAGPAQSISGNLSVSGKLQANSLALSGIFTTPYLVAGGWAVPVEAYGAVGDWNGTTGTDNTVAIQACLDSLAAGQCLLQAKSYKITGALTITKSSVGLVGVGNVLYNSTVFPTPPAASVIITTSASADIIAATGVNTTNTISQNVFKNLVLRRSVVPSGTAKGLNLQFSYGAQIDNVTSEDSIYDFYFRMVGSQGYGYIQNSAAQWGYSGVTETSGSLYGFYVDTAGAVFSPSIRLRDNFVVSNLGAGVTTYGYANVGTLGADWHLLHDEAANVNYGIYFNNSGVGYTASSDIQIVDPIMDSCKTVCIYSTGLSGSFTVTGGWMNPSGAGAVAADFESGASGSQASFYNTSIFGSGLTGGAAAIIGHNSYNLQLVGNKIQLQTSSIPAISFNGVTGGTISGNTVWSTAGSTTLVSLVSTLNVPVSNNTLNGAATNGIVLDAATHGISGIETNTCGASIATITNCVVDSGGNVTAFVSGTLLLPVAFASLPTCVAGLEGESRAVNNSNTAVFNAAVAGGGANHIIAYCNGTAWVAH